MKVTVAIPSRGRTLNLLAVVTAFYRLRSGESDLSFLIGTDEGDHETLDAIDRLKQEIPCRASIGPAGTLSEKLRRMYDDCPSDGIVTVASNRTFPVTPHWDVVLVNAAEQHPGRALWWNCDFYPGASLFALPDLARATITDIFPGIFPFWFDDNWLEEIDLFAHGFPRLRFGASYAGERFGATRDFRDYAFWIDVFSATRTRRIEAARKVCEAQGIEFAFRSEVAEYFTQRDELWRKSAGAVELANRSPGDPSTAYLAAKARAESLLRAAA